MKDNSNEATVTFCPSGEPGSDDGFSDRAVSEIESKPGSDAHTQLNVRYGALAVFVFCNYSIQVNYCLNQALC